NPSCRHCAFLGEMDMRGEAWMSRMRTGDFEGAWQISDEVLADRRGLRCNDRPRHEQWVWHGEPLRGNVLIRCYHGLGDTIQFIRYAPVVRRMAQRVSVEAQPELLSLVRTVAGIDEVCPLGQIVARSYHVAAEVMELPHILRTCIDTIPCETPYFEIQPERIAFDADLNVGLVWRAGDWDTRRSIPFEIIRELGRIPGVRWHVLQRGPAAHVWNKSFGLDSSRDDLLELAQRIAGLALLISVDSMPAHLGGALAVPTWLLLHSECDWRWMTDRSDSPWYPTMRLFRQQRSGEWSDVVHRVKRELQKELESHRRSRRAKLDQDAT